MPVYGLAEWSVALAFPPVGRGPRVDRIAARGVPARASRAAGGGRGGGRARVRLGGQRAAGARAARRRRRGRGRCPSATVGRLVFRGPSTTSGYYREARGHCGDPLAGGWLDSGDLAYLANGELYVCGRRKDLVIKGGRNIVPQEIEEAAAAVDGVRRGCVAAFGVPSAALGTESLVVVAETRADEPAERERLAAAVIRRVAEASTCRRTRWCWSLRARCRRPRAARCGARRRASCTSRARSGAPVAHDARPEVAAARGSAATEALRPPARRVRDALYAAWLLLVAAAGAARWRGCSWCWCRAAASRSRRGAAGSRLVLRLLGCRLAARGSSGCRAPAPS